MLGVLRNNQRTADGSKIKITIYLFIWTPLHQEVLVRIEKNI